MKEKLQQETRLEKFDLKLIKSNCNIESDIKNKIEGFRV